MMTIIPDANGNPMKTPRGQRADRGAEEQNCC